MKKIINNRKYDTDTAAIVGEWESMPDIRNLNYFSEKLYRKRSGEYFIHGGGGAMTQYAQDLGDNHWSGGERIIPLTYDAAREWAKTHLDADEYEAEFGEISEEEDVSAAVVLSVRVSPSAKAALDRMAARTGRSKGDLVSEALLSLS